MSRIRSERMILGTFEERVRYFKRGVNIKTIEREYALMRKVRLQVLLGRHYICGPTGWKGRRSECLYPAV